VSLDQEFVRLGEVKPLRTVFGERTKQSYKDECDINMILKRFGVTGTVEANVRTPLQADFVASMTFQDAMNAMVSARESFDKMPDAGTCRWDSQKVELINAVIGELRNITIDNGDENESY